MQLNIFRPFTFIIEAMGNLVTNDHSDSAIVERLGEVLTVEQWLQNARWKDCVQHIYYTSLI